MLDVDLMRKLRKLDRRLNRTETKAPGNGAVYSSGTYTPTYLGATTPGVTTYTTQAGFYTQIGNIVFFNGQVVWTAATGTGRAVVSLPFTPDSTANNRWAVTVRTTTVTFANGSVQARIAPGDPRIFFDSPATNAASTDINVEAAGDIIFAGFFMVVGGAGGGGGGAGLTVQEQDGAPLVTNVNTIKVTNGTLTDDGSGVVSLAIGGGSGTVTSVGLTMPGEFAVAGSPVTTSGTLAVTKANQNANLVYAGPASGAAAAPSFRSLVAADFLDALITGAAGVIFEHFLNVPPPNTGSSGMGLVMNASGSSAGASSIAPPDAASLGVLDVTTGTATNGRSGVFSYNASPGLSIRFGGGVLDLTWRFYVPTLPTAGEDYELTIGFIDAVNSSHTDGAYLLLSSASANFRYITRSNSATTNTDSGLAAVAGTWYTLRIVVNAAASAVTFTINGANSQSPATNIPTGAGREVGIGAGITKSAGTTARSVYLDYARFAWSGVSA